jgi:hypothetical protein
MRVVLTHEALRDLDAILAHTATHHPTATSAVTRLGHLSTPHGRTFTLRRAA